MHGFMHRVEQLMLERGKKQKKNTAAEMCPLMSNMKAFAETSALKQFTLVLS